MKNVLVNKELLEKYLTPEQLEEVLVPISENIDEDDCPYMLSTIANDYQDEWVVATDYTNEYLIEKYPNMCEYSEEFGGYIRGWEYGNSDKMYIVLGKSEKEIEL